MARQSKELKYNVLKQAVEFYCLSTGSDWEKFYEELVGERSWLVDKLVGVVERYMPRAEITASKDTVKGYFKGDERKEAGEFYTPLRWCAEARKYLDRYIPNWKDDYLIWDCSCGTGNLLKESGVDATHMFLSTLREEDINLVRAIPAYKGAEIFQLDFLKGLDYDTENAEFLEGLPKRLQTAIRNDEKLLFFVNPPYSVTNAQNTDVGRHMKSTPLGAASYDLYFQFCWRFMTLVEMYNLSQTYLFMFGTQVLFTGFKAADFYKEFCKTYEFIDGMTLSAREFLNTSKDIVFGVVGSLWKSRGGYQPDAEPKRVTLMKKATGSDGAIRDEGEITYVAPRVQLGEWIKPKDMLFYKEMPVCTSHLTLKGGQTYEKVARYSAKTAENAIGATVADSVLARGNFYSAILSLPFSQQYNVMTEENFYRCAVDFTYRNVQPTDWSIGRQWLSAPDEGTPEYKRFMYNSVACATFSLKSMQSAWRGIKFKGEEMDVYNYLFPLTEREIRENCTDKLVLEDLERHGLHNEFFLAKIDESRSYWTKEVTELYEWCKKFMTFSFDHRASVGYKGELIAADAGFAQLRTVFFDDMLNKDLFRKINEAYASLMPGIEKLGFLCEAQN